MVPTLNLANILADPKLLENATFTRAMTPDERKSKIKREEWNDLVKHIKDLTISAFGLGIFCVVIYLCISIINNPISSMDDKKWATSGLTLVLSGIIGYITGKSSK